MSNNFNKTKSSLKRKEESIKKLKKMKIDFIEHLPVIEDSNSIHMKSKEEIAKRAIACLITIQHACDIVNDNNVTESRNFFREMLKKYNVENVLTEKEKNIFDGTASTQDAINVTWQYESYWILVWTLGFVRKLKLPEITCDCDEAVKYVSEFESFDTFFEKIKLKSAEEVLDEADIEYRFHWACVEKKINPDTCIGSLNSEVVYERRRALEWLIGNGEWDTISLDT